MGLDLEAALDEATQELTPPLLEAWLAEERARQGAQWLPRHAEGGDGGLGSGGEEGEEEEEEEEEAKHRTVAWRDVRHLLWRFGESARQSVAGVGCWDGAVAC